MLWDLTEWSLDLDTLLQRGCTHLADYLGNHPDTLQALSACHSPELLKKAAPALVATAEALARDGEVQTATAQLRLAQGWDASLDFDPKVRAQEIANQAKAEQRVTEGVSLVTEGKVEDAQAAFAEALSLVPTLDLPGSVLADLCLYGSLSGDAAGVLAACDKMVEVDGRPVVLGRRGLARALVGDNAGAIADFQAYIDWLKQQNFPPETKESLLTSRQQWIEALKAGENPFTEAELKRLRTEWSR
jgi:tetratricopeptide (TPR) repeat protein